MRLLQLSSSDYLRNFELLKKLNEKLKLTIVVITHEMDVVKDLCSRGAVMEKGKERSSTYFQIQRVTLLLVS